MGMITGAARALYVKHPKAQGERYSQNPGEFGHNHSPLARGWFIDNAQAARSLFPYNTKLADSRYVHWKLYRSALAEPAVATIMEMH